jgi:uncharacterized protein YdaU (DUF1376 family)
MPRDRLARLCGCTVTNFERALSALIDGGKLIIKDGGLWNKRAECELELRSSKRSNAKRSANARWEKPKEKQDPGDASASIPQCESDANQNQNQNQTIDTGVSIGGGAPKARNRRPEIPLPDGWVPSERNIQDAQDRQFSAKEIDDEADRFRNHHQAKGSRYRDWDAAWRTWLGNARKFGGNRGMAGGQIAGGYGRGGSIASIVARRRAEGQV